MPSLRWRLGFAAAVTGLLVPLLLVGIVAPPGAPPRYVPPPPAAPSSVRAATAIGSLGFAVVPGTWTMATGGSVVLTAALTGSPPDCSALGTLRWSLPGISGELAYLNASSGTSVRATSYGGTFGFFTVEVELGGILGCTASAVPIDLWANGTVNVLRALAVPALSVAPNPGLPGGPVAVRWSADGGTPPYEVAVDFADGTGATIAQAGPGDGSVFHRFAPGVYAPAITVTDARGARLSTSVADPLIIAYGLSAAILASANAAEAGRPLWLNASIHGGVAPYQITWTANGVDLAGVDGDPASVRYVPSGPGPLSVALVVEDSAAAYGYEARRFSVLRAPNVSVAPAGALGEVGRPLLVGVNLTDGVPPYRLAWELSPGGPSGSENLSANGTSLLAPVPSGSGPDLLRITVTDALGGSSEGSASVGPFSVPPFVAESTPSPVLDAGRRLALAVRIVGGVPPYAWSLEPTSAVANSTALSGQVGAEGAVDWTGVPDQPGNLTLRAVVVDALGAIAQSNETVVVEPALALEVGLPTAAPRAMDPLSVSLLVTGGVPPYVAAVRLGDGPPVAANRSAPGPIDLSVTSPTSGYVELVLTVTDGLGTTINRTSSLYVAPALPSPGPSAPPAPGGTAPSTNPLATGGAAVLGGIVAAAGFVLWRRRRPAPTSEAPPSDRGRALEVVRRILSEGEAFDRESVAVIAEEEGVAPDRSAAAVDRWIRAGRVRAEPDTEGSESLRWISGPVGPSPSSGAATEAE